MLTNTPTQVLLVEDDRVMGDVLQRCLHIAGLDTTLAKSGVEACECLTQQFDVVVTDYQMPKMNGVEFIQRLRQDALHHDVPVIMVTGKRLELDSHRLQEELDVYQVISKPFGPRQLVAVISSCFENGPRARAKVGP